MVQVLTKGYTPFNFNNNEWQEPPVNGPFDFEVSIHGIRKIGELFHTLLGAPCACCPQVFSKLNKASYAVLLPAHRHSSCERKSSVSLAHRVITPKSYCDGAGHLELSSSFRCNLR
jgi:hypothetical protein